MSTAIANRVTVSVTAEHIAEGEREQCETCPVALAVKDAFPGALLVSVNGWTIRICFRDRDVLVRLADEAGDWIAAFDNCCPVSPFTFEIEIPGASA